MQGQSSSSESKGAGTGGSGEKNWCRERAIPDRMARAARTPDCIAVPELDDDQIVDCDKVHVSIDQGGLADVHHRRIARPSVALPAEPDCRTGRDPQSHPQWRRTRPD
jgi:hypothetical protein